MLCFLFLKHTYNRRSHQIYDKNCIQKKTAHYCLLVEEATFQIRILVEFRGHLKKVDDHGISESQNSILGWLNGNQNLGKLVILPINQNVDVFSTTIYC